MTTTKSTAELHSDAIRLRHFGLALDSRVRLGHDDNDLLERVCDLCSLTKSQVIRIGIRMVAEKNGVTRQNVTTISTAA